MKITGRRVKDILMIGIPASITNIMQTFMMVMTNNFLLLYGTDKVAAMGIALKVNMITALVLVGFAFGGQPLVGYNYGEMCIRDRYRSMFVKIIYVVQTTILYMWEIQ